MYNYLNLLPLWNPTDYQRKLILPFIFLILGVIFLASALTSFMKTTGLIQVINLVISTVFVVYLLGRIYGELNVKKDYINISKHGIEFRETPGLSQGWLPVTKSITFDQVKSIDIIQIKNVFYSNSENMAIYLQPVKGKPIVMGSKLNKDQIMKVGLALKGSVVISNTLQRFLGDESQVHDVIDTAKQIWNSFKSKEK